MGAEGGSDLAELAEGCAAGAWGGKRTRFNPLSRATPTLCARAPRLVTAGSGRESCCVVLGVAGGPRCPLAEPRNDALRSQPLLRAKQGESRPRSSAPPTASPVPAAQRHPGGPAALPATPSLASSPRGFAHLGWPLAALRGCGALRGAPGARPAAASPARRRRRRSLEPRARASARPAAAPGLCVPAHGVSRPPSARPSSSRPCSSHPPPPRGSGRSPGPAARGAGVLEKGVGGLSFSRSGARADAKAEEEVRGAWGKSGPFGLSVRPFLPGPGIVWRLGKALGEEPRARGKQPGSSPGRERSGLKSLFCLIWSRDLKRSLQYPPFGMSSGLGRGVSRSCHDKSSRQKEGHVLQVSDHREPNRWGRGQSHPGCEWGN